MLYTVVSLEDVFYEPRKSAQCVKATEHCFVEIKSGRINSVCSTDPKDYFKFNIGDKYSCAD